MTTAPVTRPIEHPHTATPESVASSLSSDLASGLTTARVEEALRVHGPNRLAESKRRPTLLRFLDQFRDLLIAILLVAAVVSFVVSGEL